MFDSSNHLCSAHIAGCQGPDGATCCGSCLMATDQDAEILKQERDFYRRNPDAQ